ncbi:MAG: hypothetical protein E7643_04795 [Ruminococcaceae bacterium]|nr:hypothetical protein [Oscillospiraceae bacterium]
MFKAGFSRVDVTPPLGSYISGYFHARYAKGVLDPLELNAAAFSDGENTVLLIIADFIGVDKIHCDLIREKIALRVGIPAEHIMLTALHQHTSVCIGMKEPNTRSDVFYMEDVYRKYCDVAQMAINDMAECAPSYAAEETQEPVAFIRRYFMKDGSVATNPGERRDEILRPCNDADHTVRLLRFRREGKKDIALVNFCTHPDVIGGEYLSADWPGFVRRFVEHDLDGVSCLLLNGYQGDSNHCDFIGGVHGGYEHSRHMGRVIADTVLRIWERTKSLKIERVGAAMDLVYNKTRTEGEAEYEKARALLDGDGEAHMKNPLVGITELGRATRIVNIRKSAPIYQKVPVTALALGDTVIVGLGGEPFTHYGVALRERLPNKTVITACCANGYEGYLPTEKAFEEGGYEAVSSPFSPSLEKDCVETAVRLIDEIE